MEYLFFYVITKGKILLLIVAIPFILLFYGFQGGEKGVMQYYEIEKRILIDAGHGGRDPGANYGPILEKDITLAIAQELQKELESRNMTGIMSREGDYLLVEGPIWKDLQARALIGREEGVDLLVSIHVNNFVSSYCSGGQVFYNPKHEESKLLAQAIQEELYTIQIENTRTIMPGGNLYLLKALDVPSVLVEVGFIKNEKDRASMVTSDGQRELARVICQGIVRYFREEMAELTMTHSLIEGDPPLHTPPKEAILYFIHENLGILRPVTVLLPLKTMEILDGEEYARTLLRLLLKGPPQGMGLMAPFHEKEVLQVKVEGEVLQIHLKETIKKDFLGGSLLEQLMILSVKETLKGIPQISQVFILIEGEELATIGGHILLSH